MYSSGTNLLPHLGYQQTLPNKDIRLYSKRANVPGLQLADILAHPVKQACLVEQGLISEGPGPFGQRRVAAVKTKVLHWHCY